MGSGFGASWTRHEVKPMERASLSDRIEGVALESWARLVGYASLPLEVRSVSTEGFSYAVSFAVPLLRGVVSQIGEGPTHTYFVHYRTVNRLIDDIALRISLVIEEDGFTALPIAASQTVDRSTMSGVFQHKTAATSAGLGFVGKSGLLITEEFGPRVRLGTVLTTAPLEAGEPRTTRGCGDCSLCATQCPAGAISGREWDASGNAWNLVDKEACSRHMRKAYGHIGRGAVCGVCMAVCPIGYR